MFEFGPDAQGSPTPEAAVRELIRLTLPNFPIQVDDRLSNSPAAANAERGLYVARSAPGSVTIGVREQGRLAGTIDVGQVDSGWVIHGYEMCSGLLRKSY